MLRVVPRGAHQRNSAGERFEDTDGGNPGKSFTIGAAWNVDGHIEAGKYLRDTKVRNPS